MGSKRSYASGENKALFVLSKGHCYFPDCFKPVLVKDSRGKYRVAVEIAHIRAFEDDGPRADKLLDRRERNRFWNLLLLCGKHHDEVDDKDNLEIYTVEELTRWKVFREQELESVLDRLESPSPKILEDHIVTALEAMHGEAMAAINDLAAVVSVDVVGQLKVLVSREMERSYLDSDDIAAFENSTRVLAEHVPLLHEASRQLRSLPEDAHTLRYAGYVIDDHAPALRSTADRLEVQTTQLSRVVDKMQDPAGIVARFVESLDRAEIVGGDARALDDAAARLEAATVGLSQIGGIVDTADEISARLIEHADYLPDPAVHWKFFRWGASLGAIFVISIGILTKILLG